MSRCRGEDPKKTAWLFPFAMFRTEPSVRNGGVQKGMGYECKQVERRLKPGEIYQEERITGSRFISTENDSIAFPTDGLYKVYADLYLVVGSSQVHLVSNSQPFSVGGSTTTPKQATGRIVRTNIRKTKVQLSLGKDHRVKPEDRFWYGFKAGGSMLYFTVTEVGEETAWAEAKELVYADNHPLMRRVPFPSVGALVYLSSDGRR